MCGIVGIKTADKLGFYAQDRDMIKGMLVVNSLRGAHSTGLAGVCSRRENEKEDVGLIKAINSPYYLFDWPKADEFFRRVMSSYDVLIGHGRYATRGAINADNAHPFEEGHITLVHNGGITNFYQLKDNTLDKDVEVDSHLVARLIERDGWETTLPKLRGAYALVWYDSRDGSLHFARNKDRPMSIAKLGKRDVIIYASESATLNWAADRYGFTIESMFNTEPFTHYVFEKGSIDWVETKYKEVFTVPATGWDGCGEKTKTLSKKERRRLAAIERNKSKTNPLLSGGIQLGEEVELSILDTVPINHSTMYDLNRVLVKCECIKYPNIEFKFTIDGEEENKYIEADKIIAQVKNVYSSDNQDTINKVPWIAWVGDPIAVKDDSFLSIEHFIEGPIRYPKYRLLEMISCGCGWCSTPIPEEYINKVDKLMVYDDGETDSVICESCTKNYYDMPNHLTS